MTLITLKGGSGKEVGDERGEGKGREKEGERKGEGRGWDKDEDVLRGEEACGWRKTMKIY